MLAGLFKHYLKVNKGKKTISIATCASPISIAVATDTYTLTRLALRGHCRMTTYKTTGRRALGHTRRFSSKT